MAAAKNVENVKSACVHALASVCVSLRCGSLRSDACAKTYIVNNRHVIEFFDSLLLQLGRHCWCCRPTPAAAPKGARRAQRRFLCLIGARLLLLRVDHVRTRGHVAHGSRRRSTPYAATDAVQSGLDRAHP